jgi:type IV fimbrial biogenesis protein FimT
MVTVAIAAILLAIALPSFQSSLRSNRVATATNEALASLALARSEAIRNTRGAGVCASTDGASCGVDWNGGWLVWSDTDGNGTIDTGETIVRYSQGKASVAMTGTAAILAFDSRGRARGGAQTINIVPEGVTTPARCISVSLTGQTHVTQAACS